MKLSKRLMSSGVLESGRVRHCAEWEISSLATGSRFGGSRILWAATVRRAQPSGAAPRARFPGLFRWFKAR